MSFQSPCPSLVYVRVSRSLHRMNAEFRDIFMVFIIFIVFAHWVIFGWLFLINQRRLFLTLGIFVRKRFRYHPFSSWANPQNNQIVFNHKQQDHSFRGHHLENNVLDILADSPAEGEVLSGSIDPSPFWIDHRGTALLIESFLSSLNENYNQPNAFHDLNQLDLIIPLGEFFNPFGEFCDSTAALM